MWTRIVQAIKLLMILSITFCSVSVGLFFLKLSSDTKKITDSVQQTAVAVQQVTDSLKITIVSVNDTLTDTQRVLQVASGTVNIARDTLRDEQANIKLANQQTLETMQGVNTLVAHADLSQKQIVDNVSQTLQSIQPVMQQTADTLRVTQDVISATGPMVNNLTDTTEHLNSISASLDTVVKNATKPQPWYKKMIGYVWVPIKIVAIFAK